MGRRFRIRFLIIAIVFAFLATGGCVTAYATKDAVFYSATAYGKGTEEDPYRIYNDDQFYNLQEIANSPKSEEMTSDKHFKLMNDIKCMFYLWQTSYGFYGTLDGNGHTLDVANKRLFCSLKSNGVVKNLTVKLNGDIHAGTNTCGFINTIEPNAIVENCIFEGRVMVLFPSGYIKKSIVYATCCTINRGQINDCTFNMIITWGVEEEPTVYKFRSISMLRLYGVAFYGDGEINNCIYNGWMYAIDWAQQTELCGFACRSGKISNCVFNGNIYTQCHRVNMGEMYVYGFCPQNVIDCVFNGDILYVYREPEYCVIAGEDCTYTHNGSIREWKED